MEHGVFAGALLEMGIEFSLKRVLNAKTKCTDFIRYSLGAMEGFWTR